MPRFPRVFANVTYYFEFLPQLESSDEKICLALFASSDVINDYASPKSKAPFSVSHFFFPCYMLSFAVKVVQDIGIAVWDVGLTLVNLVMPKRKVGKVTPAGHPGADGKWPEYIPPKEGDSRCSCPALNAMANHGILPRNGKNIAFKEMGSLINKTYNFAPTFCFFVPNYAAKMLEKNYNTDTFDLANLDLHNAIEHDASLVRQDLHFEPNQATIHLPYVKELLESATGRDADGNEVLTVSDLSRILSKRRAESRANNPNFSLSRIHKMFGSSNSSTLLTIFGGRVKDLETLLLEERLPDGWESRIRESQGLTLLTFNRTVAKVEKGVDESKFTRETSTVEAPRN